ncbi:hypothetical protein BDN72DRAFT_675977, partial [Pluteus cervinus]
MTLPPGPVYLIHNIYRLVGPPVVVYAALHYLANYVDSIPRWAAPISAVLILPVLLFAPIVWADIKNERLRRALGADPVPFVRGGGFLGRHLTKMFIEQFKALYPSNFYGHLP